MPENKVDVNRNSISFAETKKLLGEIRCGYRIMNRSWHTVTEYLWCDGKTHAPIKSKLVNKLSQRNNAIFELDFARAEIEHEEPILVKFLILPFAKLRTMELF